eukprot:TRINITY_DN11023_c0_g1_i1.p1 TRINITY_DN11023_c0_g1~~TRINITY_DN11023_c0_g1_i1.p1  ORF type:complete len:68 (-),score=3.61 TRINITY_DN11023_c0_g1_i1:10-213(-)
MVVSSPQKSELTEIQSSVWTLNFSWNFQTTLNPTHHRTPHTKYTQVPLTRKSTYEHETIACLFLPPT